MRNRFLPSVLLLLAAALALAVAANAEDEEADAAEARAAEEAARKAGAKVYDDKALGTNDRSCSTCHSNPKRPDLSLKGVNDRFPRYDRNAGRVITLQEKFAQMQDRSLKARKPMPLGDERWTALEIYLRSLK